MRRDPKRQAEPGLVCRLSDQTGRRGPQDYSRPLAEGTRHATRRYIREDDRLVDPASARNRTGRCGPGFSPGYGGSPHRSRPKGRATSAPEATECAQSCLRSARRNQASASNGGGKPPPSKNPRRQSARATTLLQLEDDGVDVGGSNVLHGVCPGLVIHHGTVRQFRLDVVATWDVGLTCPQSWYQRLR